MAAISASAVKDLREKTGVGMMEAKKALEETGGDAEKAIDLLRKKGLSAAAKKAARVASEGMIASHIAGKIGVLAEVNSETDFVAKNEDFQRFAKGVAELAATQNPADVEAIAQMTIGGENVEAKRNALVQKIGENIAVRRFVRYETAGQLAIYLHGNRIGVMVDFTGGDEQLGKDIAMHIAASKPKALTREGVPAADVERERSIAQQKAAESGKPDEIVARMVDGSVQKYLKEVTLLGQPFVKDDKLTIEQLLKGKGASVAAFTLYVVGEGIEKKVSDFAAEVAAQAAAAATR